MVTMHDGKHRHIAVLTAGQVQDVPALTRWFAKVGYMLAETGVPLREAAKIQAALLRAAASTVPATRK
ncbi:MAG TPA: hypothetical protein VNU46_01760 [Gemmatimonadaceae bacterium]|jgi:hypothetical protein|nr:hypothetical protein [Gemmatimonadaceae bacterium]